MQDNNRPTLAMMIIGAVLVVVTLAVWLVAESQHIGTGALLAFIVPIVGALFLAGPVGAARDAAQAAATQTNGALNDRIKAAVAAALADRDAARTRQAKGDISADDQAAQAVAARSSETSSAT